MITITLSLFRMGLSLSIFCCTHTVMNLEDYNLKVVTRADKMCGLNPISVCVINGTDYVCNPGETEDEKIYIPVEIISKMV